MAKKVVDEFGDTEEATGSGEPVGALEAVAPAQAGRPSTDEPDPVIPSNEPEPAAVEAAKALIEATVPEIDKVRGEFLAAQAKLVKLEKDRDAAVKVVEAVHGEKARLAAVRAIQKQSVEASNARLAQAAAIATTLGPLAPKTYASPLDQRMATRPRNAAGMAAYYANKNAEQRQAQA